MSLNSYIKSIDSCEKLTQEETNRLLRLAQKGDIEARNKVVEANLGLVIRIAKRWGYLQYSNVMDLVQEGNLGLMKSIDIYDFNRKSEFPACAVWSISRNMFRYIQNNSRIVRIPVYLQERIIKIKGKQAKGEALTEKEKKTLEKGEYSMLCLDSPNENNTGTVHDILACFQDPIDKIELEDKTNRFLEVVSELSDREQDIILGRFKGETLHEIANRWNISRERVRQIEFRIMNKLKRRVR